MASSLNAKNYLNAVGYLLNTIGTFATGFIGSGNLPDQGEISAKYQVRITMNSGKGLPDPSFVSVCDCQKFVYLQTSCI